MCGWIFLAGIHKGVFAYRGRARGNPAIKVRRSNLWYGAARRRVACYLRISNSNKRRTNRSDSYGPGQCTHTAAAGACTIREGRGFFGRGGGFIVLLKLGGKWVCGVEMGGGSRLYGRGNSRIAGVLLGALTRGGDWFYWDVCKWVGYFYLGNEIVGIRMSVESWDMRCAEGDLEYTLNFQRIAYFFIRYLSFMRPRKCSFTLTL